jgi:parallel beta-helix repeat protein
MTRCFRLLAALPLLLAGLAGGASAETRVGGDITGVVRWTKAQSPFIVTADIMVRKGARLIIDPGVVVRFKPNIADQKGLRPFDLEVTVYGTLEAQGADNDSIFFTSDAVEPSWEDWAGIVVPDAGGKAVLSRVALEFATFGISVIEGDLDLSRSAIRYCRHKGISIIRGRARLNRNFITGIGNFAGTGIGIYLLQSPDVVLEGNIIFGAQSAMACERGSNAKILRNLLTLSKTYGIEVTNSSPEITGNTITQNEVGLLLRGESFPKVRDNNIFGNAMFEVVVNSYKATADGKPVEIDMSNNWWGRITPDVVSDKIDDADDDPTAGAVARILPVRKEEYRAE